MHDRSRWLGFVVPLTLGLAAFIVAGCGSTTTPAVNRPAPTSTPTVAPAAVTTTDPIPTSGGTVSLPATSSGYSAAFSIAAGAPSGVTVTATETTSAPSNAPAPSSAARHPAALSGATTFLYVTLQFSASMSASYFTGGSVTVPSVPTGVWFGLEIDDITASPATVLGDIGPMTVSGTTATWTSGGGGNSPTLQSGHTYLFQYFEVNGASPTPTPTASASPAGSGSPTATPTATASATTHPTATPTASPTASASPSGSQTPLAVTFTGGTSGAQATTNGSDYVDASDSDGTGTFVQATFSGGSPTSYTLTGTIADSDSQISPSSAWQTANGGPGDLTGGIAYAMITPSTSVTLTSISVTFGSDNIGSGKTCNLYGLNENGSTWGWNQLAGPVSVTIPEQVTFTVSSSVSNQISLSPSSTNIIGVACTASG